MLGEFLKKIKYKISSNLNKLFVKFKLIFILEIDSVFATNSSSLMRDAFQRSGIEKKKKDENTIEIDLQQQKLLLYEAEITCRLQMAEIDGKSELMLLYSFTVFGPIVFYFRLFFK